MAAEKILVCGGAGYIGAHTCKALAEAGFQPVVLDNLSTGHRSFVRWGPLIEADIRDARAVCETVRTHGIAAVIHFAACAYVGESVEDPAKYYDNNVLGSLRLLEGLREAGCKRLVFSSSCAVYGSPARVPITESTPLEPVNPYGRSKAFVEKILGDFRAAYGLKATILRYFNAAGAGHEAQLGELREPETHLIPRAILSIQGYVRNFEVFGSNYDTPDGTAIRDYIHVTDLAQGHVLALRALLAGAEGGVFNLGTGEGHSVLAVLKAIERVTGEKLGSPLGGRRVGDPPILIADPALAQRELRFRPAHSSLDEIIRSAWNWHQRAHPKKVT